MASFVYGLIVMLAFHIASVGGFIPGMDAKASAGEVGDLIKLYNRDRQLDLESEIFNTRRRQCVAIGPLRTEYAHELSKLQARWRELTGAESGPELTECEDLGGEGE